MRPVTEQDWELWEKNPALFERGRPHSSETKEKLRQGAFRQHATGRVNKNGLSVGQARTTAERKAAWTPEKRVAQGKRTGQAYRDGRMQVHGRYKGHWSVYDGPKGRINMRSQSEVLFAEKLDRHGIDWLYEPRRFDLGWTTYLPDFHLPERDLWVEVKGHLSKTAAQKINDFQALGHRLVMTTYREVREVGLPFNTLMST